MNMKENVKIVFLDVDGVLNGYGYFTKSLYYLYKLFGKRYEVFGVHEMKVKRLAKIIKRTNSKIVISSTWRGAIKMYLKELFQDKDICDSDICEMFNLMRECDFKQVIDETKCRSYDDIIKLLKLFKRYNLEIIGFTRNGCSEKREDQINGWMDTHNEYNIKSFCVIDDDIGDLQSFVGKELVRTVYNRKIKSKHWTTTINGIKRKHVKQAIWILNNIIEEEK